MSKWLSCVNQFSGHASLVKLLIDRGANVDHHDFTDHYVAFHLAAMNGKLVIANELSLL